MKRSTAKTEHKIATAETAKYEEKSAAKKTTFYSIEEYAEQKLATNRHIQ